MSNKVLTAFIILDFYTLYNFEWCMMAFTAIFCNMTLNEYMNVQNYTYLYDAHKVKCLNDYKPQSIYYHKRVTVCQAIYNLVTFCLNK